MSRYDWKPKHDEMIRRHYMAGSRRRPNGTQRLTAAQLGELFGVSAGTIYARAMFLGISQPQGLVMRNPELQDLLRARHADGWLDGEIAAAWSQDHPELVCDRRTLTAIRNALKLPSNAGNKRHRDQIRQRTRQQLAAAGLESVADLRAEAYRRYVREHGWPDYLRVRHVQILDLLYERGPHTREQIAQAIGWRIERGQRYMLSSKYGRGSYLSDLLAAGLVVRSRTRCVRGDRRGKSLYQYFCAVHVVRHDPTTWPGEEWARGQIYGKQSESGAGGSAAAATAGGTDVSGKAASGRGRKRQRGGRPGRGRRDRVAGQGG
jgi:hypothetical protein